MFASCVYDQILTLPSECCSRTQDFIDSILYIFIGLGILSRSAHSTATFDINRTFSPTEALLNVFAFFLHQTPLCKPQRWLCIGIPADQWFVK